MRKEYNVNMKTTDVIIGIIIGFAIIGWFLVGAKAGESSADKRFSDCITLAQSVVPDPNDTEARSNFIRQCYEIDNEKSETQNTQVK